MKRSAIGIALIVLALLSLWFIFRDREAQEESDIAPVSAPDLVLPAAGPPSAPGPTRESVPAPPLPADGAQVRIRFHDLISGEPIAPRAVVMLEQAGTARVIEPTDDREFDISRSEPGVLVAAFAAHLPLLAVIRPAASEGEVAINAYPSARITVQFEGCDARTLPSDAKIRLGIEGSARELSRSDHGQWMSLQHRFVSWAHESGSPDLTREPAQWFSGDQARVWRAGALQGLKNRDPRSDTTVAAMVMFSFEAERPVTGGTLVWELAPAGLEMSWRTALPLRQVEPVSSLGGVTLTSEDGERYGKFVVARGETKLRLAWASAGSITGRIPREGLSSDVLAPRAILYSIVRGGESSPENGQLTNQKDGVVDLVDGSFRFVDLPPGEYQVNAGWAIASNVYLSASRTLLEAGQDQDMGTCPVRPGEPVRLDLRLRDLAGNPLRPEDVFRPGLSPRLQINVSDDTKDALDPTTYLELPLPYHASMLLHGLHPGFLWISPRSYPLAAEELLEGVQFVRIEPNGARITFPEENGLTMHTEFMVGTVPATLRFEYPEEGLDRSYHLYLTHIASGTKIPAYNLHEALRPRKQIVEAVLNLVPGQYEALVLSGVAMNAQPGEVHHYAFETISVEADGRPITLKLEPGLTALGPEDAPELRPVRDVAQFMLRSIGGVPLKNSAVIAGKIGPDGRVRLHGVPRGAVLQQNRDPISWTVSEQGLLVPVR